LYGILAYKIEKYFKTRNEHENDEKVQEVEIWASINTASVGEATLKL